MTVDTPDLFVYDHNLTAASLGHFGTGRNDIGVHTHSNVCVRCPELKITL